MVFFGLGKKYRFVLGITSLNFPVAARPKCIQCTGKTTDERDTCINNPPQATSCEFPYQKYCYVADDGIGQIYKYMGELHRSQYATTSSMFRGI